MLSIEKSFLPAPENTPRCSGVTKTPHCKVSDRKQCVEKMDYSGAYGLCDLCYPSSLETAAVAK